MKLIVSLLPYTHDLTNSIIKLCQVMGIEPTLERQNALRHECISQIMQKICPDFQQYMYNLMELPVWETLNYGDRPFDYEVVNFFTESFRMFAMSFWQELASKGVFELHDKNAMYLIESCTPSIAIIAVYMDSSFV